MGAQSDRKPCGLWRGGAGFGRQRTLGQVSCPFGLGQGPIRNAGKISKIAVTCGPGLIGCLGIGLSVAKSLGLLWGVPVVGVNHLRGHAFSPFMGLKARQRGRLGRLLASSRVACFGRKHPFVLHGRRAENRGFGENRR